MNIPQNAAPAGPTPEAVHSFAQSVALAIEAPENSVVASIDNPTPKGDPSQGPLTYQYTQKHLDYEVYGSTTVIKTYDGKIYNMLLGFREISNYDGSIRCKKDQAISEIPQYWLNTHGQKPLSIEAQADLLVFADVSPAHLVHQIKVTGKNYSNEMTGLILLVSALDCSVEGQIGLIVR